MNYLDKLYFGAALKMHSILLSNASGSGESGINLNDIKGGSADGGTFSAVVESVKGVSQDLYTTLMIIGGFGGVLMLIIAFLYFALAGNGNNKDQAKGKIITVLIAVAGIFAAVFIVGLAQKVGESLVE